MDLTANPQAATELHRYAEALLASLAAHGIVPPPPPSFDDVPDLWLAPAASALVALLHNEDALPDLAKAAQRDEQRTALFLCLALAVAGYGDRIHASWLGTAFGELSVDKPVTHGQRGLWVAAAKGAYGPAGKIFVLRKLDGVAVADQAQPEEWLRALVPDEPAVVIPSSLSDFPELAEVPDIATPTQASARLTRLKARCIEITSTRQAKEHSTAPLHNRGARPTAAWSHDEPLAVLRTLIGASGPEAPMASLASHLLDDLRPGADPHLTTIALHVVTSAIRSMAEQQQHLTQHPPPSSVSVPVLGHRILLHPEGPDVDSLAAAEQAILAEGTPRRGGLALPYVLLALSAVAIIVGVAASWFFVAPAPILAAVAGHRLWARRKQRLADDAYVTARIAELRDLAQGAVWALHDYAREAEQRAETAASDLTELTRLLRRGPRAG
ncbi:hypothetical protein [Sinosporangium album]|nr:hypothetical protein [Sinosporangium album]